MKKWWCVGCGGWRTVLRACGVLGCVHTQPLSLQAAGACGAHARRDAIDDRSDALAVRLAKGGDAEDRAEGRHAAWLWTRARRAKGLRSSGLNTTIACGDVRWFYTISPRRAERLASSLIGIKLSGSCCLCCSCCGAITPTEPLAAIVLTDCAVRRLSP